MELEAGGDPRPNEKDKHKNISSTQQTVTARDVTQLTMDQTAVFTPR